MLETCACQSSACYVLVGFVDVYFADGNDFAGVLNKSISDAASYSINLC